MRDVVQIPGYSDYAVDRFGAIYTRRPRGGRKSVPFGSAVGEWRVMGQDQTPRGYFRVRVGKDGSAARTAMLSHRLITLAFYGERPSGMVVAHMNGNKLDNRLDNLAYVTPAENKAHELIHNTRYCGDRHHSRTVKSDQWDQLLCRLKGGESMTSLGKEYGLSRQAISRRVRLTTGTITHA